jgi:hypothetical protein
VPDAEELPDRNELHATAVARVRRGRLALIVGALLCVLAVPVGVLTSMDGGWTTRRVTTFLLPVGVVAVLLAVLYPLTRRQDRDAPLAFGADAATRRAVRRALRTGKAPDLRVDALARDMATRAVRNTWQLWLFIGVLAVQIVGAALRILGRAGAVQTGLAVLIVLSFGVSLALMMVHRRRSRSYLDTPPDVATSGAPR